MRVIWSIDHHMPESLFGVWYQSHYFLKWTAACFLTQCFKLQHSLAVHSIKKIPLFFINASECPLSKSLRKRTSFLEITWSAIHVYNDDFHHPVKLCCIHYVHRQQFYAAGNLSHSRKWWSCFFLSKDSRSFSCRCSAKATTSKYLLNGFNDNQVQHLKYSECSQSLWVYENTNSHRDVKSFAFVEQCYTRLAP